MAPKTTPRAIWRIIRSFMKLPNGSRLSCGALKKDSFPNLRAPIEDFTIEVGGVELDDARNFKYLVLTVRVDRPHRPERRVRKCIANEPRNLVCGADA